MTNRDEADKYQYHSHCKGSLKVHLIFVTRFRKRILNGVMAEKCKHYICTIAERHGWKILEIETDKDHIHLLLEYPPIESISKVVQVLKQQSTYYMWQEFGATLRNEYWHQKTLWSKGYFFCSVGEASADTIAKYIENQG